MQHHTINFVDGQGNTKTVDFYTERNASIVDGMVIWNNDDKSLCIPLDRIVIVWSEVVG